MINDGDSETMASKQSIIDKHDKDVHQLLVATGSPTVSSEHKFLSSKLYHLEESLSVTSTAINTLPSDVDDQALIQKYEEEFSSYKEQLTAYCDGLSGLELEEGDSLLFLYSKLKKLHSDYSHKVKKVLNAQDLSFITFLTATEAKSESSKT